MSYLWHESCTDAPVHFIEAGKPPCTPHTERSVRAGPGDWIVRVIPPYSQSSYCQTQSPRHWPTLKWILIRGSINILFNTLKCRRCNTFPELGPVPAPSLYFAKINYDTAVGRSSAPQWAISCQMWSADGAHRHRRHGVLTRGVNHKAGGCGAHHRASVDPPSSAIFLWLHYQASLGAGAECPQSPGPIPGIIKQHIDQQQQHY